MARKKHEVTQYAESVIKGKILACQFIIQACQRHLDDLKKAKKRGYYFDEEAADHAIEFFDYLKHSKGEWAGQSFSLELWQKFIIGSIFGWKRKKDGMRRFRTAYIEIPRKNGKSTFVSGIGLYLLVADDEPGAEIYTAATKREQAKITHSESTRMVRSSPALRKRVGIFKDNLHVIKTNSFFVPLGADADTSDGLNVHGALVDELHAHKTRDLWDVLETATGARRQPLMLAITTAGFNQTSICYEQHEYAEKILNGTIEDDTYFTFIATIDKDDDWTDPVAWKKANPNFGVSIKEDDLARLCKKAKELPTAQNNFLTKRLNVWTQQANRWINLSLWDENAGKVDESRLAGRKCYGGLDLSSVSDITAWVMAFPDEQDQEKIDIVARFWCPESRLYDKENRYMAQYQAWEKQGLLYATPGDAVDYEFIKEQIFKDAQTFKLIDMNVDRLFQGYQIAMEIEEEGISVVPMGMGFTSFAIPMKEFERRLLNRKINHGGNPVLRWMADNLAVKTDPAGNIKPNKADSQGKIDGIVALIMALDRAMRHEDKTSIYETQGIRTI
ncbi:terminase large subunit [Aneurinibacillus sp. BA2021]|nr:terminase large subunit [Aneurinibacillus sp. BA2021]